MDIAGTGSLASPIACLDRTRVNDDLVVVFCAIVVVAAIGYTGCVLVDVLVY